MPTRSKGRPKRASDPFEAVKPLVVLGLLGMILYGAFSVIRRGPSGSAGTALPGLAPPAVSVGGPQAAPVELPAVPPPPVPAAVPAAPTESLAAGRPASVADGPPPPMVLRAVSSSPPAAGVVEPVPSPPTVVESPPAVPERQPAAFAAAWADAHEKLAAARYAEALSLLSTWYDDPSLGPEETHRLEELLGQLAGTVIYSQEDHLLPPHIVAPGENLRDIAASLNVPWPVLGKINGVDAPGRLVPGEPLKVISGPFDAVVSLSRRRLSLQLKGNYAGSFTVVVGRQFESHVGTSLPVKRVRRAQRPAAAPVAATAVAQAAHEEEQSPPKQILIEGGLVIEAADDPAAVAESAAAKSLVVSSRDLDELVDILGEGSRVFVKP